MVDDVNDKAHPNRFAAYNWLGTSKSEAGRLALEGRIIVLLNGEVNSLKESEMIACVEALAKIGNGLSADFVRKVCDHLEYWMYMSYRPLDEGRSSTGADQISNLFKAYHSLSLLGFREEAMSRLQRVWAEYFCEMESSDQMEFFRGIKDAETYPLRSQR